LGQLNLVLRTLQRLVPLLMPPGAFSRNSRARLETECHCRRLSGQQHLLDAQLVQDASW
jgi:hypothetical protein